MSLEKQMADLQSAIEDLTAAVKGSAKSGASEDARPARRSRDEEAPRRAREEKGDGESDKPGRGRPAGKKDEELTIDSVRGAFAKYLGPKDGKDYEDNAEFVGAMLDELGVDSIREMEEKDWKASMHWLKLKKKGSKVDFADRGEDEGSSGKRGRDLV